MSTIKINVTEDDITNSIRMNTNSCMVAQAVRRRLDLPDDASVTIGIGNGENYIQGPKGHRIDIDLEKKVQAKIMRWDQGTKVRPFDFDVEFPDDWRTQLLGK